MAEASYIRVMSATDTQSQPSSPLRFDAFLHPHRSLSVPAFWILMGALITISLIIGGVFLAAGAWPVFGLYGVDILIVYLAFRKNYRSAMVYEKVRLSDDRLVVEKGDRQGVQQVWECQPFWLRVTIDNPGQHNNQIRLSSHGRSVTVGSFLSPEERLDFAAALDRALTDLRRPHALNRPQEAGGG